MSKPVPTAPAEKGKQNKRMMWYTLAFMGFTTVWGFNNIINGYAYYGDGDWHDMYIGEIVEIIRG